MIRNFVKIGNCNTITGIKRIYLTNYSLNKKFCYKQTLLKSLSTFSSKNTKNDHTTNNNRKQHLLFSAFSISIYFLYKWFDNKNWQIHALEKDKKRLDLEPGLPIKTLPTYSMEEVSKHNDPNDSVWIVYKAGVYDITPFISYHPGGDNILLGAGNSVEPFWQTYAQHHTAQVYQILESYRIGNLREEDRLKSGDLVRSEYIYDFIPERDPLLIVHHETPFNAETPGEILVNNFYTPNKYFFIRNHLSVPYVNPEEYVLEIEGYGLEKSFQFTLDELKTLFPKHTVTSVIQCGGNRREDLNKVKEVKGISWKIGAIGNTRWSGAKLIDILRYCDAKLDHPSINHVQFEGLDLDATSAPYGASVPSEKALDPNAEFLLAYEMNGEPLPADHGFPVRLIAPGIVGARNVKWLKRIILSDHESTSHWQRNDYKSFPSNKDHATPMEFEKAHAIQEMPIQSAICKPKNQEQVRICWKDIDGRMHPLIEASGYAWSGGGRSVIRVDISIDGGYTWTEAQLEQETPPKGHTRTYSWTLWKVDLPLRNDQIFQGNNIEIICRAFDSSYNTQPAQNKEIWNFRGLLNNSWHRVNVNIF